MMSVGIAQRPRMERDASGVLDCQVDPERSAWTWRDSIEPVLEGVPTFHVNRERVPSRVLRERAAASSVVTGGNDEPWTRTGAIDIGVKTSVENEIAPKHTVGLPVELAVII
jgi:hypothetical protein